MIDLKSVQRDCLEGKIGVVSAVEEIDRAIGGITRVDFKEGKKFKISNHNTMFALDVNRIKNRDIEKLHGLAVVAYFKAQENGAKQPGEVHISEEASTKHHMRGIYLIFLKYIG